MEPSRVVAAVVGLAGFAVALVAGIGADNPFEVCIGRSVWALVACSVVGLVLAPVLRIATAPAAPRAPSDRPPGS